MLIPIKRYIYIQSGCFPHTLVKVFDDFPKAEDYLRSLPVEERKALSISCNTVYIFEEDK